MRTLAASVRSEEGWTSARIVERQLKGALLRRGVEVEGWRHFGKLRGAYFQDAHGPVVVVNTRLPLGARVFTLAHELKHHLVDRDQIGATCNTSRPSTLIERGAEEFAAELLLPADLLEDAWRSLGTDDRRCPIEAVVRLKASTGTTLSYQALGISAVRRGLAKSGAFDGVRWMDMQERIVGHRRRC